MTGLGSFPFARHYLGNHCYFLLLRLLRCFSSARSPLIKRCHAFSMTGCPIRKSVDQFAFADTHSLSQLITSFFASESLGIPRVPFITFFTLMALLLPWRCWRNRLLPVPALSMLSLLFLPICQRTSVSTE